MGVGRAARMGNKTETVTAAHGAPLALPRNRAEAPHRARVRFGVIGYGYWGPQLVRNLDRLTMGEVAYIVDFSPERQEVARLEFPSSSVTSDLEEVLRSDVDAVVVATPIRTHYELARTALERGKDVFVEKPLAASSVQAEELVALARRLGRVLMVGHTFMYNPAVEELRRLVHDGALGSLYYIDAVRVNLGLFQRDINVMWDLAPHDLSILSYILDMHPTAVSAHGGAYVRQNIHDVIYLTLRYPTGLLAHIQVSWLNPSKVRRFTVVGDQRMVVYDDVEATEKIRIFNRGVDAPSHTSTFGEFQLSYRYGDIVSPHILWSEPLQLECRHFAECIMERTTPRSDGRSGLQIVRILEAADRSLANGGDFVPVALDEEPTAE
jgi:predicted dehydrogenase